jgi:hypothetical protein
MSVAQAAPRCIAEYIQTNRYEKGVRLATQRMKRILGHASIVTTERYARLSDQAVYAESRRVYAHLAGEDSPA